MNDWASIIPLILLVLAFLFLVVRPARARQRDFQRLQGQLEVGQQIMLTSGIFGELAAIGEETVELQVAPGTVITVNRHAVARVVEAVPDDDASTDL
ncbi:preprotein translocase subunit YajC [Aeromicrobium wangtongii]|uniref:preprotein translocase subunit YajC n=1 Tax=Aeromicrobium wangtongii TaxID=2969247 RepID=UPI002018240C|nr:preprotein translocase subunit YajC [Aeromicrobium wangtongii]MCL3819085.1 preprotein translocase subunit YajC [Aeromicrobium wangtongii]